MTGPTSVVLADDHPVVRQGLRALLETEPDLGVVGEATDGLEAVELVERLRPGVLIVDLMMPGLSGLDVTDRVARRWPQTHVVILSMHGTEAYVLEALRKGASAFVVKEADGDELIRAIREAAADRRYLSPPLSDKAVQAYMGVAKRDMTDPYETLTHREREVLQLAAEGLTSALTARRLGISPRTAETHRTHAMAKLDLHDRAALVHYVSERGLLAPPAGRLSRQGGPRGPGRS